MGVCGIVNSFVAEPVDVGDSRGDVSVLTGDLLSWPAWSWPATGATRPLSLAGEAMNQPSA